MPVTRKITFARIAGIVTIICSVYGISTTIYGQIEKNRLDIQNAAISRIVYRGEIAKFQDSVRRAITRMEKKLKLEPTFSK